MKHDTVALLGTPTVELLGATKAAASMASARVAIGSSVDNLVDWMNRDRRPIAVVTGMSAGAREAVLSFRARVPSAAVAVIGVTKEITDLSFEEAYAAGYDDVCARDDRRLGNRLRQLVEVGPMDVTPSDRRVVIADADRMTRLMTGRVFRNAGFDVRFATNAAEAYECATATDVYVVVVSSDLHGTSQDGLSARAWREGCDVAWIITTPPRDLGVQEASLDVPPESRVAVHDSFATPETLLFVANELVNRPAVEARKSERLLYGACVRFRAAGRPDGDVGHLFNISAGGVYVRTLAPPPRGSEIWLEFNPPRSDRLVHLEGTAVWTRRYGPGSGATVPTGFGLQITGASKADMVRYGRSYRTYLAERMAVKRREAHPCGGDSVSAPAA
jgi:PilZ domain